ncbi:MAG: anaerobic ribonucleoside-triphosphate reductase [Candidatus Pacebacteria bacterium]|nr:anaerobic ribonucleoside-triphosphate reductase [Candidatus Paceibacterota bacterium]
MGPDNFFCHDCGREVKINSNYEIENGQLLKYVIDDGTDMVVFKCNDCFSKDKSLRNYKNTEVYSRVVGYLRPVSQWNEGKQQEFKDRKEFNIEEI